MPDDGSQRTEEREKEAARLWKAKHEDHVKRLMKSNRYMYAPSGSDTLHPELWTGAHWNWLERQT